MECFSLKEDIEKKEKKERGKKPYIMYRIGGNGATLRRLSSAINKDAYQQKLGQNFEYI